jgi:hypothetical protein
MEGRLSGLQQGRTILQRVDQKLEACFHVHLRLGIPCTTSQAAALRRMDEAKFPLDPLKLMLPRSFR